MLVRRTKEVVPVLLGPSIPNRHHGAAAEEHWCRTMMILFKPWRLPSGLKLPTQSWAKAFSLEEFTPDLHAFMTNTTILAECRDARDAQRASRANKGPVAWNVTHDAPPASADELLTNLILDEARDVVSAQVDDSDAHVDGDEPQALLAEQVFGPSFVLSSSQGGVSDAARVILDEQDHAQVRTHTDLIRALKRTKRPLSRDAVEENDSDEDDERSQSEQEQLEIVPPSTI
ncbi:hypothetical protein M408DRAFT_29595 [Serendipita vermifera MAFF 305830]|uniref:Uncharacterized protein n=1 Tax=Serendipita vermifera MAFF 305830 TaxID=933852 RepID=A0A0C3AMY6_SERVB|nr:hypothetical protein M408DRAFT_29595 [Serendipita vermifera MAFF 305830]